MINKQDYEILVRECCNRLPYGVMVELNGIYGKLKDIEVTHYYNDTNEVQEIKAYTNFFQPNEPIDIENFKLVLRPFNDIRKEEVKQLNNIIGREWYDVDILIKDIQKNGVVVDMRLLQKIFNYFNSRHLDYNGCIEKGIAVNNKKVGEFGEYF